MLKDTFSRDRFVGAIGYEQNATEITKMQAQFNNKHYHLFNIYYVPSALRVLFKILIKIL